MLCSGLDWGRKGGKAPAGDKFLTRLEIQVKKAGPHFLRTLRKKMFGTRSYIIVTFAFLFWLYYVASGGGSFEPEEWPEVPVARVEPAPEPQSEPRSEPRSEPEPVIAEEIAPAEPEPAPEVDGAAILDALTEAAPAETSPLPDLSGAGLENAFSFTEPVAPIEISPEAIVAAPEPTPEFVRIAGSRVNIRSGPGTENGVVTTLDGGEVVEALSRAENGWVEVRLPNDLGSGWVSGSLVEPATE
jgi:hypothetical protein